MPQVSCPHCQAVISFSEDERGNVIPCSRCEQRFRLPAARVIRPARSSWEQDDAADDDRRAPVKKRGPNWLLIGLLGGGLAAILCGGLGVAGIVYMSRAIHEQMEEDAAEVARARAQAIAVTAGPLAEEFRTNRDAANLKYIGNYVRVQGVVDEVSVDEDGSPVVYLQGSKGPPAVRIACLFDGDDDKMARRAQRLLKGRPVTILGQCNGQDGDVKLNDCELVD
jgi:hypothetical protein